MTDRDPIGSAIRRTRRDERLGEGPRVCALCGYAQPEALIPVPPDWIKTHGIPWSLFEAHHVVGKKHDSEFVVLLCRNCHAMATEGLLQAGVSMRPEPDGNARVALMLEALAAFREQEAAALRRWAVLLKAPTSEVANER